MDSQYIYQSSQNKSLQALMNHKHNGFNNKKAQGNVLLNMVLLTLAMFLITLFIGWGNGVFAFVLEAMVFIFLIRKIKL